MSRSFNKIMLLLLIILVSSCAPEMITDAELFDIASTKKSVDVQNVNSEIKTCDYELLNISAGDSLAIDCLIDLKGKTLELKNDITLNYNGGDIINGKLVFDGGIIDGRLLNKDLEIEGQVQLKDHIFKFDPKRWDIKQGRIGKTTAFANRLNIEKLMNTVKEMGADTFKIAHFDAYFDVDTNTNPRDKNFYIWLEAINVPSDFSLIMSNDTHLRVFPNNSKKYVLLAVYKAKNVLIKGGNLHGDRDEHDYSDGSSHEWGQVMMLKSVANTVIDNVNLKYGSGDGLKIESSAFTFQDNYDPSHDIVIKNCKFDSNRRNNMSITDGQNIIVENNEFYGAGIDTPNSKGTNPRYGIDVEPYRKTTPDQIIFYEKVNGVIIRNNKQHGSGRGGFIIASGDNVTVENNEVENGIAYKFVNNCIIKNNRVIASSENNTYGISAGFENNQGSSGNQVYGNYVAGFTNGIKISGDDHQIYNNTIKDCQSGIFGKNFSNTKVLSNTITSKNLKSRGIFIHYTSVNRVLFKDNVIDVPNNPFKFDLINLEKGQEKYCAHLVNNKFTSPSVGLLRNSVGVSLMKNTINTGIEVFDSKNFSIEDNEITSTKDDGIYLREKNSAIQIIRNEINVPKNKSCIKIQETTNPSDIEKISNACI